MLTRSLALPPVAGRKQTRTASPSMIESTSSMLIPKLSLLRFWDNGKQLSIKRPIDRRWKPGRRNRCNSSPNLFAICPKLVHWSISFGSFFIGSLAISNTMLYLFLTTPSQYNHQNQSSEPEKVSVQVIVIYTNIYVISWTSNVKKLADTQKDMDSTTAKPIQSSTLIMHGMQCKLKNIGISWTQHGALVIWIRNVASSENWIASTFSCVLTGWSSVICQRHPPGSYWENPLARNNTCRCHALSRTTSIWISRWSLLSFKLMQHWYMTSRTHWSSYELQMMSNWSPI